MSTTDDILGAFKDLGQETVKGIAQSLGAAWTDMEPAQRARLEDVAREAADAALSHMAGFDDGGRYARALVAADAVAYGLKIRASEILQASIATAFLKALSIGLKIGLPLLRIALAAI